MVSGSFRPLPQGNAIPGRGRVGPDQGDLPPPLRPEEAEAIQQARLRLSRRAPLSRPPLHVSEMSQRISCGELAPMLLETARLRRLS